jgi:nucleotide-binding universal stress UspA family protein
MDLSKLKRRPSYPFETIAVAVSFSPRCEYVLAEAKRYADIFGSALLLLHIGEKTGKKEEELDKMLHRNGIKESEVRIIWMEGEPVETILKLCKLNIVDLLILGALEKENLLKFYLGSIARSISRRAKCSVLLLSEPESSPAKIKKIFVNGVENPKTIHTISTALYLAKHFKVKEITLVNEMDVPGLTMTMAEDSTQPEVKEIKKNISEQADETLASVVEQCDAGNIRIHNKMVKGKQGYAISKYARERKADLLVLNSPDKQMNLLDRIFTHDIEHVLADLPCNVLIVHSRVQND